MFGGVASFLGAAVMGFVSVVAPLNIAPAEYTPSTVPPLCSTIDTQAEVEATRIEKISNYHLLSDDGTSWTADVQSTIVLCTVNASGTIYITPQLATNFTAALAGSRGGFRIQMFQLQDSSGKIVQNTCSSTESTFGAAILTSTPGWRVNAYSNAQPCALSLFPTTTAGENQLNGSITSVRYSGCFFLTNVNTASALIANNSCELSAQPEKSALVKWGLNYQTGNPDTDSGSWYGGVGSKAPDFPPIAPPIGAGPSGDELNERCGEGVDSFVLNIPAFMGCLFIPTGFDSDGKLRTLLDSSAFSNFAGLTEVVSVVPQCGNIVSIDLPFDAPNSESQVRVSSCDLANQIPSWVKYLIFALLLLSLLYSLYFQTIDALDAAPTPQSPRTVINVNGGD